MRGSLSVVDTVGQELLLALQKVICQAGFEQVPDTAEMLLLRLKEPQTRFEDWWRGALPFAGIRVRAGTLRSRTRVSNITQSELRTALVTNYAAAVCSDEKRGQVTDAANEDAQMANGDSAVPKGNSQMANEDSVDNEVAQFIFRWDVSQGCQNLMRVSWGRDAPELTAEISLMGRVTPRFGPSDVLIALGPWPIAGTQGKSTGLLSEGHPHPPPRMSGPGPLLGRGSDWPQVPRTQPAPVQVVPRAQYVPLQEPWGSMYLRLRALEARGETATLNQLIAGFWMHAVWNGQEATAPFTNSQLSELPLAWHLAELSRNWPDGWIHDLL
ncbi:hypothetical protein GNI_068950 [Gregarina niphandrodes]|uniref:Uncharacterized protein n=1 Tax=Gregarina niphandrodes TaxID=110365 RepID=A0A023B7K7_GRENI|nr:hypothetical protein GNI_068950 [Gregarina niphandrodes]EZG67420.1 hypothetical protein GNI_068950 [Gregarina niphandrodes]|eukprot:XP_011130253.1 hypothetical protein GNI_068950 [Gregarina niphandrodes]